MHISPENWGPAFWKTLHVACLAAASRDELQQFIDGYKLVIPCGSCRGHFIQIVDENPLPVLEYFKWSVDVHNLVNDRIGKPRYSYNQALQALLDKPTKDYSIPILLAVMMLLIAFLIFNRK